MHGRRRSPFRGRAARRCSGFRRRSASNAAGPAWANSSAVRELDFHDNFFAEESSHPGDNIASLIAVAQQCGRSGEDLIRGIVTAYEIQIDLAKGIALNPYRIDHVAHLGPAIAGGIGALLGLDAATLYQAIQHRGACLGRDPARPEGRHLLVEGERAGPCRQGGDRGCRPRHARRDEPLADLRRRLRHSRDPPRRAGDGLPCAAARGGRAEAGDPGDLREGAFGRLSRPGDHRSRLPHARARSAISRRSNR